MVAHAEGSGSGSLPAGGTTEQVLTKKSNLSGDADWETIGADGSITVGDQSIISGALNPSAGAGVPAFQGSLYLRFFGSDGTLWLKTDSPDTGWHQVSTGASSVSTEPVSVTAAEILAVSSIRVELLAGTPGKVDVPVALIVTMAASGSGGYTLGSPLQLTSGSSALAVDGLGAALQAGLAQMGIDMLGYNQAVPAGDVIEGGISLTSAADPTPSGGTPDWGFTGTLYYFEFTP